MRGITSFLHCVAQGDEPGDAYIEKRKRKNIERKELQNKRQQKKDDERTARLKKMTA